MDTKEQEETPAWDGEFVGAIDPGKVNPAAWVGVFGVGESGPVRVKTEWGAAGEDIVGAVAGGGKATLNEVSLTAGRLIANLPGSADTHYVVETPNTFGGGGAFLNVSAAVGAGVCYGYLRGRGLEVRMSHSRTKQAAMELLSERMGVELEKHVDGNDAKAKARNRVINKRNAVALVERLMSMSHDTDGLALLKKHSTKRDDIADSVLLALGLRMDLAKKQKRRPKGKASRADS